MAGVIKGLLVKNNGVEPKRGAHNQAVDNIYYNQRMDFQDNL